MEEDGTYVEINTEHEDWIAEKFYVIYDGDKEWWTLELAGCNLVSCKFERWTTKGA